MFPRETEPLVHTLTHTPTYKHRDRAQAERRIYFHALSSGWELPVFLWSSALLMVWKVIFFYQWLFGAREGINIWLIVLQLCFPRGPGPADSWWLMLIFSITSPVSTRLTHSLPSPPAWGSWNTDHIESSPSHSAEGLMVMACHIHQVSSVHPVPNNSYVGGHWNKEKLCNLLHSRKSLWLVFVLFCFHYF